MNEVWFSSPDDNIRRERLIARHIRFGKTGDAATAWANGPNQHNADLVMATRPHADLIISEDEVNSTRLPATLDASMR